MKLYPLKVMCLVSGVIAFLATAGCATAPSSAQGKSNIEIKGNTALATAQTSDSSLVRIFDSAAGYAVFPTVGKGAMGVGGAYGKGVLYERGSALGYCDLSQATIGLQLGGQSYT